MDNYQSLLDRGFKMTPATCNVLLETLFKHGKHKEANDLWETMIDNHTPPSFIGINAESYNVMVNQCFREGKFQEAIEVFHRQPRKNVQMDVGCFNNIIGKLCENGMLAEAVKLFEEMEKKSVLPDVYTYTYLVDSCFKEGHVEDTMEYFYKMADGKQHGPKFNIGFFNRMFEGLTEAGRIDDALKVYGRMPDKEIKPNMTTFEILIKALCKEGDLDQARGLVMDMARGSIVPPPEFRESVVNFFKKAGRQEEIEKAFEEKPMPTTQPRTEYQSRTEYHSRNAVGAGQVKQPGFSSASAVEPGFVYSQPQQSTLSNTPNQQPEFGSSRSWNSGFGAPQVQPGYGAPQPVQAVAGSSQPPRPQFGASQGEPGYSNIGNQHGQFGSPQREPKFSNHPPQVGYGAQLPQSGYRFELQQEQVGFGNRVAQPAYVASSQPSYDTRWSSSGYGSTQGQLGYGGPQAQSHESQLPHHQGSFGMPHIQNNNGFYRHNPGYVPSNGLQGFDAPHGDSETAASKDYQETTTSEDRQQVAFLKA
jgi:pentatricopeptide repeat protein